MQTTYDFRQIYCAQNAISEGEYAEHLLNKALPIHARAFRSVLSFAFDNQNHFRSDFDFLNDVGCLRSYRDYRQSVDQFIENPWNKRSVLRWMLHLRVSTTRVRRIVLEQLKAQTKTDIQLAVNAEGRHVDLAPSASTPLAVSVEGVLHERQQADIESRLDPITATQTTATTHVRTEHSRSTFGNGALMLAAARHERSYSPSPNHKPTASAMADEIKVLRVVNERLKMDLEKVTNQRDILKQAAAILAAP